MSMSAIHDALFAGIAENLSPTAQAERDTAQKLIDDYIAKSQDERVNSRVKQIASIHQTMSDLKLDLDTEIGQATYKAMLSQLKSLS